ncbi:MAG TPA: bifunctional adenosylcobinamide kinase/adenosylcobinamide-phosphate guanylyltransferase [Candidatus Aquabacterium excrementipullorum]|nr:bifunctional adenosylcobinamide kinase/adenosylcobinamide-phosphate guanylyltransferase [Candidatus Aquabacterium excrementipullorum]
MPLSQHHLVIGGQRSGKSRQAERMARAWQGQAADREVVVLATALSSDDEMRARIERHRQDRPAGFLTMEEPHELAQALRRASSPGRLVLVDCLTLWLTNVLMPAGHGEGPGTAPGPRPWTALQAELLEALPALPGPVVLVSNEIGWGVIPMGREVRQFVDELGRLNQEVAQCCGHITLMAAGQAWTRPVERWA